MSKYIPDYVKCHQCEQGWHAGPHRAVVNAGCTAAFWGNTEQTWRLVQDVLAEGISVKSAVHKDDDGDIVVVYLWFRHPTERVVAEKHWPRCNDIAVHFHRELYAARAEKQ